MNRTKIEWTLNPDGTLGYTWNPITGCLNGCEYCYARKLANTRLKARYLANEVLSVPFRSSMNNLEQYNRWKSASLDPFYPRFWPERLRDITGWLEKLAPQEAFNPSRRPKPRGVFVCDMSDLFGIGIPETWTRQVLNAIEANSQSRFYLLTKQPQNLIKWSPFPENCFVGVTATDTLMLINACKYLRSIEATVKYLSLEPLLDWDTHGVDTLVRRLFYDAHIGLVIQGAQTKPTRLPKIEWVTEIVEAADKAEIPVFLKDNLKPLLPMSKLFYKDGYYTDIDHPYLDLTYRQEMPQR